MIRIPKGQKIELTFVVFVKLITKEKSLRKKWMSRQIYDSYRLPWPQHAWTLTDILVFFTLKKSNDNAIFKFGKETTWSFMQLTKMLASQHNDIPTHACLVDWREP